MCELKQTSKHPLLSKLHEELEEMIRWMATEPSPTAKLINGLNIYTTDINDFGVIRPATVVNSDSAEFLHTWPIHPTYSRRYLHSNFDDSLFPHHFGIEKKLRDIRADRVLINELPDGLEVSADLGRHPVAKLIDDWFWNWNGPIPRQLLKFCNLSRLDDPEAAEEAELMSQMWEYEAQMGREQDEIDRASDWYYM